MVKQQLWDGGDNMGTHAHIDGYKIAPEESES